jgi:hypothetical protein
MDALLTLERLDEWTFQVMVPPGWAQGRGAFGGLVVAWLVRAVEACETDAARVVRTLSAELIGPVQVGLATLRVEPLRIGNGISTYSARLLQSGPDGKLEVQTQLVATLGRKRVMDRDFSMISAPERRPAEKSRVFPVPHPPGPEFGQHMEFRPLGTLPTLAAGQLLDGKARTDGYVRAKDCPSRVDVGYLAILADTFWPALFATESTFRPMATLAFTLEILCDPTQLDPAAPYFVHAEAKAGIDGYVSEERQVFSEDGTLLALNHQTFVIIK